jgi:hypothetical protein
MGIIFSLIVSSLNVFADSITGISTTTMIYSDDSNKLDESNVKIKREEALKFAKETLSKYFNCKIDNTFDEMIELRENRYPVKHYYWDISWDKHVDGNWNSIYVEVNADNGKIENIHKHISSNGEYGAQIQMPKILKKEARKISDDFLKHYKSKEFDEIVLKSDNIRSNKDFNFNYGRVHNGIIFNKNSISITVDGVTGVIIDYNENWNDKITFEKLENIKDKKDVSDLFYKNVKMDLLYIPELNNDKKSKLVYCHNYNNGFRVISAKSGEFIKSNSKISKKLSADEIDKLIVNKYVTTTKNNKLSTDEAKKIMEKYISELCSSFIIKSIIYDTEESKYRANIVSGKDNNYKREGQLSIDEITGYITNYYIYDYQSEEVTSNNKSWEECYDIAIKTLAKYYPNNLKQIDTKEDYIYINKEDKPKNYLFSFARVANNITMNRNYINIHIDSNTGEVVGISKSWDDNIKFSSKENIIESEKAKKIFFEKYQPILIYATKADKNKAELMYILQRKDSKNTWEYDYIDAKSGEFLDYKGRIREETKQKEISKHWAAKELNIFQEQNFIDMSKTDINSPITYGELIKLIARVKGYGVYIFHSEKPTKLLFTNITEKDDIYPYLEYVVNTDILENRAININLDRKITRQELAKIITNLKKVDSIAELNKIYTVNEVFTDASEIDKDFIGYVALCYGLDIMKGNNGRFNPKKEVTYVEAIVTLYKALVE